MSPAPRRVRVVVVGYGMAAARFAEEVREHDPEARRVALTILGAEPHVAYNRVLLSSVLAGQLGPDDVRMHGDDWGRAHQVDIQRATTVVAVRRDRCEVELAGGSVVGYDHLVLATGSRAHLPPVDGLREPGGDQAPGTARFRTIDDCRRILAGAPDARIVVLGGGLLGVEAARGLAGRGARVTVAHPAAHLMERQLDAGAARTLLRRLRGLGIDVRLGAVAARWTPGDGLKLDDGTSLPCDLMVVATGVRPETALAVSAGLRADRGVLVDDRLTTSDPRIRAIGDCSQHRGAVAGLVQPAWEQAAVLAALLTGADPAARYRGTPTVTRLKAHGIELAAMGDPGADDADDDETTEMLRFDDPSRGRYAKLALRDDRVTGAVMLGMPDAAAVVTQLFDAGARAPADRLALLLGRALPRQGPADDAGEVASLPANAIVCRCNTVTKGALAAAWDRGARSVRDLVTATRATTGCGGCRDGITGLAAWLADAGSGQHAAGAEVMV